MAHTAYASEEKKFKYMNSESQKNLKAQTLGDNPRIT